MFVFRPLMCNIQERCTSALLILCHQSVNPFRSEFIFAINSLSIRVLYMRSKGLFVAERIS